MTLMHPSRICAYAAMVAALFAASLAMAEDQLTTQATLLDRIQIEDIVTKYYWDITSGGRKDISLHYAKDATFDVNGVVFKGHDEIQLMYGTDDNMGAPPGGHFNMLMNNPLIRVNGNWQIVTDSNVSVAKAWGRQTFVDLANDLLTRP